MSYPQMVPRQSSLDKKECQTKTPKEVKEAIEANKSLVTALRSFAKKVDKEGSAIPSRAGIKSLLVGDYEFVMRPNHPEWGVTIKKGQDSLHFMNEGDFFALDYNSSYDPSRGSVGGSERFFSYSPDKCVGEGDAALYTEKVKKFIALMKPDSSKVRDF